jgi:hypothetical protein
MVIRAGLRLGSDEVERHYLVGHGDHHMAEAVEVLSQTVLGGIVRSRLAAKRGRNRLAIGGRLQRCDIVSPATRNDVRNVHFFPLTVTVRVKRW